MVREIYDANQKVTSHQYSYLLRNLNIPKNSMNQLYAYSRHDLFLPMQRCIARVNEAVIELSSQYQIDFNQLSIIQEENQMIVENIKKINLERES